MDIQTTGVVLRGVDYKESDRILTVLTAENGLMTVKARGCRRKNSPLAAAAQLFVCSQMTLFQYGEFLTLREAVVQEQFWGLREDMGKLALASYCAEVAQTVAVEGEGNPELLSLFLNSLYAMDKLDKPLELIRCAFDLRCMAIAGYAPLLDGCAVCGKAEPEEARWNLGAGVVTCGACAGDRGESVPLSPGMLAAARHMVYGDPKRLFSVRLGREELAALAELGAQYVSEQLERRFRTLDFYLSVRE